jgi:hypothetical protein
MNYQILFDYYFKNKYQAEYRFDENRRWRFDYAFPDSMVAIEIEGGIWINGGHNRGAGYIDNLEKYNAAIEKGWALLRYAPNQIDFEQIKRVIRGRKCLK